MFGRSGLERFKKAQSAEPFSISTDLSPIIPSQAKAVTPPPKQPEAAPLFGQSQQVTQVGGGQSNWQPPDWAIEPRSGVYCLEVLKDGEVLDRVPLNRRRHIFGRQSHTCDFVLDHQSVSRQHAAVIPHKNGSIFVIDLGSAHGTFVANERLTKDTPVELEVGQSLRFAASTRTYILRKDDAAFFTQPPSCSELKHMPPPDPSDEEAVVAYNTLLNRYGLSKSDVLPKPNETANLSTSKRNTDHSQRASKRMKRAKVTFLDQVGGRLVEVVGFSDGADVETEPGPMGVKEGSLVGKYESLVQSVVIPKGKEQHFSPENGSSQGGVSNKLLEVLSRVKASPKCAADGLYGDLFTVGSSWASPSSQGETAAVKNELSEKQSSYSCREKSENGLNCYSSEKDDDLFGD